MKIVRRLSDGLVQYKTTEPHELTDRYYKSNGIKAIDIKNTTHEVVEDVVLPLDFRMGIHAYNDGVWGVLNQERYDEILASELVEAKSKSITKFEDDTDAFIRKTVGARTGEYELAEKEATAFKIADYLGDVPSSVSSDAIANGYSNTIACDTILIMAENWRAMQASLRAKRLLTKAQANQSSTISELYIIQNTWDIFIDTLNQ